jgi:hypothetical protein
MKHQQNKTSNTCMNRLEECFEDIVLDLLIESLQQIRLQRLLTDDDDNACWLCYKHQCPSRDQIPF